MIPRDDLTFWPTTSKKAVGFGKKRPLQADTIQDIYRRILELDPMCEQARYKLASLMAAKAEAAREKYEWVYQQEDAAKALPGSDMRYPLALALLRDCFAS